MKNQAKNVCVVHCVHERGCVERCTCIESKNVCVICFFFFVVASQPLVLSYLCKVHLKNYFRLSIISCLLLLIRDQNIFSSSQAIKCWCGAWCIGWAGKWNKNIVFSFRRRKMTTQRRDNNVSSTYTYSPSHWVWIMCTSLSVKPAQQQQEKRNDFSIKREWKKKKKQ